MKVILDTNILVADFWLRGATFEILFENSERTGVKIFVPQIVIDETINKYKEKLNEGQKGIEKHIKNLSRILKDEPVQEFDGAWIEARANEYEAFLKEKIKTERIKVLSYPKTDHKKIARRALERKKPFAESGTGYRDYLIWENVKSCVRKKSSPDPIPATIFISNNVKDFATKEFRIHDELISELTQDGRCADELEYFKSLNDFIERRITPTLEKLEKEKVKIQNEEYESLELYSKVSQFLDKEILGRELDNNDLGLSSKLVSPEVFKYNEHYELEIIQVSRLAYGKFLVEASIDLNCDIRVSVSIGDYDSLQEDDKPGIVEEVWGESSERWGDYYGSWNDPHYLVGEIPMDLEIKLHIILNSKMEVLQIGVKKIDGKFS